MEAADLSSTQRAGRPASWAITTALAVLAIGGLVSMVLLVARQEDAQLRARAALLRDLKELKPQYTITLNGRLATNPAEIVGAIRGVTSISAHHSSPLRPVHVEIGDGDRIVRVTLAEDSERADEFWVFRPRTLPLGNPLGQEAGRITDSRLRHYLAAGGSR